jgi:hypothetical protein
MTPHSFFTVLLKITGLLFIKELIVGFFQMLGLLFNPAYGSSPLLPALALIFVVAVYLLLIWFFLFRTEFIIRKLSLDKHFQQESFDLNIKMASFLNVATIVLGGILLIDAVPSFIREIFYMLQQPNGEVFFRSSSSLPVIYSFTEILIALVLISGHNRIAGWVQKKKDTE